MDAWLPEDLRALLFGRPPHEREGAPEPELLTDLAAALPEALLEQAIHVIADLGLITPAQRRRVLNTLVAQCPASGTEDLLSDLVLRLPDLAAQMPAASLRGIISRVRQFAPGEFRGNALASLAARLPGSQGQEFLLALIRALPPQPDYYQQQDLAAILAAWPWPLSPGAAPRLVSAASALHDQEDRARALLNLERFMPAPEKEDILRQVQEASSSIERLCTRSRVQVLAALSLQIPQSASKGLAREALSLAREIASESERPLALGDLARSLEGPLLEEVLKEIQALRPDPLTAAELAPFLSPIQMADLLKTLPDLDGLGALTVLDQVLPYLKPGKVTLAFRVLMKSAWPASDRNRALMMLHRHLLDHYPEAIPQVFSQDPLHRQAVLLRQVAPSMLKQVPDQERLALFREILDHIRSRYGGAMASPPVCAQEGPGQEEVMATPSGYPKEDQSPGAATAASPIPAAPASSRSSETWLDTAPGGKPAPEMPSFKDVRVEAEPAEENRASRFNRPFQGFRGDKEYAGAGPAPREEYRGDAYLMPESKRQVNTGFSRLEASRIPLDPQVPLRPGQAYYFWLEVGQRLPGAIDVAPAALPVELLPREARLQVALFAFPEEIVITPGADVGELQINPNGSVQVARPAYRPKGLRQGRFLKRRLFFPVTMPNRVGVFRLRLSLYCQQVLVQSHLVRVEVSADGTRLPTGQSLAPGQALETRVDYTLSASLRPEHLAGLQSHRLSLMLNDNGDGTHGFRFFGADGKLAFKQEAALPGQELQTHIDKARGELRRAAWGEASAWQAQPYRYADPPSEALFRDDLVQLAKTGYRFYVDLISRLAGGRDPVQAHRARRDLETLMLKPGLVQLASKMSARHIVPLALFYDYPLDTTLPKDRYSLCPDFLHSLAAGAALAETACFKGACPSRGQDMVVCPSGFWGFRHQLGLPASVGEADDFTPAISCAGAPQLTVAVSTDPAFAWRPRHEEKLKGLVPGLGWHYAQNREETLQLMKQEPAHLVYFYCHGGLQEGVPFIQVGPLEERGITKDLLVDQDIFWESQPRPLIFINGCHTTALEPEQAYDLVTGFVEMANAAGVIGTEITVFEPLAVGFAEECLSHFLNHVPIGEAVRLARLKLLGEKNPGPGLHPLRRGQPLVGPWIMPLGWKMEMGE